MLSGLTQEIVLLSDGVQSRKGFLFVLEGIDGSGKTTACDRLESLLVRDGFDIERLREPTTESKWGIEIRRRSPQGELTPEEELELFIRDREWHVNNRILPALAAGKVVLLDRYFFATGAYQSTVTPYHWKEILKRNREEIHAPDPDLLIILDVPADLGLQRATGREGKANLQFEKLDRLIKVRQNYLEIAKEDSSYSVVVDASQPLDTVVEEIHRHVLSILHAIV
jgi:dTMP kinase